MEYKSKNVGCQNCKKDFVIEPDDFSFYEKIGVPAPTWCPHCRFIRKLTFVNERSLYKRNCENCKKSIISMYSSDSLIPTWCVKCHLSDNWDAFDYGRDYDFSEPFFEQFKKLKSVVPHRALDQNERNGEGCEYANFCYTSKNIYLSFVSPSNENIKYSRCFFKHNKNCLDSLIIKANEKGYELVRSSQNYNSTFLVESDRCISSHFLYDCSNCNNCCISSSLRNKSYVFRNKQLTKEEYENSITTLKLDTYSGQCEAKDKFTELAKKAIHKHAYIKNSVNVVGDFIENSKNIYHCYGLVDGENMKYVFFGVNTTKDSQDLVFTGKVEECYEFAIGGRGGSRVFYSFSCGGGSKNLFYSDQCKGCSDCFGCAGLNKKQYCILNKQYGKDEYFELVDRIKVHMNEMPYINKIGRKYLYGEYFPEEISPFAYNETIAFEEHPITKEEAILLGYKWKEPELKSYSSTVTTEDLLDSIHDVSDAICDEVIKCPNKGDTKTQCLSAYRILRDELAFYRQMNLPLPRLCPNCRYYQRLKWKNPFRFYKRDCMCDLAGHEHDGKCMNEFETMYAPSRPEKILCKQCYQKEVY